MELLIKDYKIKNLFCEMSAEELLKYYRSYQKCLLTEKLDGVWKNIIDEYKKFVGCSEHSKEIEAICERNMFTEIAHRYFGIVNMVLY